MYEARIKTANCLKPFKCDICEKNFSRKWSMKDHILRVHEEIKPFKCDICGINHSQKSHLIKHKLYKHDGKKFENEMKSKWSTNDLNDLVDKEQESSLSNLTILESRSGTAKAQSKGDSDNACKLCGKIFQQKRNLSAHVSVVHEGKKPHTCHICNKNFSRKAAMTEHVRCVHNKIKNFHCKKCLTKFGRSHDLTAHLNSCGKL